MSQFVEVVPAYGRDYPNQRAVRAAWNLNKDFQDPSTGRYLNKQDAERYDLSVIVRYNNLKKVVNV